MKHGTTLWSLADLMRSAATGKTSKDGRHYYPARPLGMTAFGHRIGIAWLVFTGRADAVVWPENQ